MFNRAAAFDTAGVRCYIGMFVESYHFTKPMFCVFTSCFNFCGELYKAPTARHVDILGGIVVSEKWQNQGALNHLYSLGQNM